MNLHLFKKPAPPETPSVLPPLYGQWMDDFLGGPIPRETEATCDNCAMCTGNGRNGHQRAPAGLVSYDPRVKCCTYMPQLPNFLVGRILGEDDPSLAAGKVTVQARLQAGIGVTPLGIGRPPIYELLQDSGRPAFGQSRALRCPYYQDKDGGRCGIWRHREAVCATWFCRYVRGAVGMDFWNTILELLSAVEISLTRWCVSELDIGSDALKNLFPSRFDRRSSHALDHRQLDGVADPVAHRAVWGNWAGRESEFFHECAQRVTPLTWEEVSAIGGPAVQIHSQLARAAYRNLMVDESPISLRVGTFQVIQMDAEQTTVCSYSPTHPAVLPNDLIDLLRQVEGPCTAEDLQALATEKCLQLDAALVRRLTDFRILNSHR